jgi:uncharacterized protein (DUF342 family)
MNRTLQYFKNIKFNSNANRFVAEQNKKLYSLHNSRQQLRQQSKQIIIRKFSSSSNNSNLNEIKIWVGVGIIAFSYSVYVKVKIYFYNKK